MDFSGRKKLGNYGRRPPQDINTLRPNFRPSASCSVLVRSVGKSPTLCVDSGVFHSQIMLRGMLGGMFWFRFTILTCIVGLVGFNRSPQRQK
jgi:hypothetical protein